MGALEVAGIAPGRDRIVVRHGRHVAAEGPRIKGQERKSAGDGASRLRPPP
jgi:hypothetical protein